MGGRCGWKRVTHISHIRWRAKWFRRRLHVLTNVTWPISRDRHGNRIDENKKLFCALNHEKCAILYNGWGHDWIMPSWKWNMIMGFDRNMRRDPGHLDHVTHLLISAWSISDRWYDPCETALICDLIKVQFLRWVTSEGCNTLNGWHDPDKLAPEGTMPTGETLRQWSRYLPVI